MTTCTACGTDVTGMKFCRECGAPVQPAIEKTAAPASSFCSSCGHQAEPGERFCSNCGTQLNAGSGVPPNLLKQAIPSLGSIQQQSPYSQPQYGQPASPYSQQPVYDPSQYSQYPQNPQSQYGQPAYPQPQYGQPQYPQQYGQQYPQTRLPT